MSTKTPMKYRIVGGKNPKTGEPIKRPVITERETYYIDKVVEYAIKNGYVRGQFHDMRGALNGFIEAIEQLGRDGKCVNLNNWLRVHAELTGTVDETLQLTKANELRVCITPLQDLKSDVANFSWTNIADLSLIARFKTISSSGGKNGEVKKNTGFTITGANLFYNNAWGDTVSVSFINEDGENTEVQLTPAESSESVMRFVWPEELATAPAGATLEFKATLHGEEGGAACPTKITAKVVA